MAPFCNPLALRAIAAHRAAKKRKERLAVLRPVLLAGALGTALTALAVALSVWANSAP